MVLCRRKDRIIRVISPQRARKKTQKPQKNSLCGFCASFCALCGEIRDKLFPNQRPSLLFKLRDELLHHLVDDLLAERLAEIL